ncbi:hypothetical protein CCZ01_04900 [Helicobacter monodelphidis]|uniref:hypothetical protein n=1 Tax=Helicobacter sp. 15-1451 TaxID=2004995 RepID=UPI000DCD59EF|nr:hypothetical protein [Helicobacter sp. 15-1451]RAX57788.1 hypothetical protein CCZ01_04900 [Helicobacter sp. 15-1451]
MVNILSIAKTAKIFVYLIVFSTLAFAVDRDIESVLKRLLEPRVFEKNKTFIMNGIFKRSQLYFNEYGPDYPKILSRLKDNGLLKLSVPSVRAFKIQIEVSDSPIFVTRSVQSALKSLGYYYATPIQAEFVDGRFFLVLLMNAENALDPVSFMQEMQEYGYRLTSLTRENEVLWQYGFKLTSPKIPEALNLEYGVEMSHGNLKGEYWIFLNRRGGILQFSPLHGGKIYPDLAFYDSSLRLISLEKASFKNGVYQQKIPQEVSFVRLSDSHTPSNVKTGLRFVLERL